MITENGFLETEETIRPTTPEEDAAYAAIGEDYSTTARALLMTCRHVMSGREINICELATGDHDDDEGFDGNVIDRLAGEFAREIAAWNYGRATA